MEHIAGVIRSVRLTEKASVLGQVSKYVFEVAVDANKVEVRRAVEVLFGKRVLSVNTCNYRGKQRRMRTAAAGCAPHWKKAVVTLADGETIDFA